MEIDALIAHLQESLTAPDLSERDIELIERKLIILKQQQLQA